MQKTDQYLQKTANLLLILFPLLIAFGRAPADGALSIIAVLFIVHTILIKDYNWLKVGWVQAFLLLWAWMIIRVLFTEDILFGIGRSLSVGRYLIFAAALAFWLLKDIKIQRYLYISIGVAVIFLSLDGFYQYATGFDILGKPAWDAARLTGPYNSPFLGNNIFPFALLFALPLIAKLRNSKKYSHDIILLTLCALPFLGVFISGDRSPTLLSAFGLFIAFILANKAIKFRLLGLAAIGILASAMLMIGNPELVKRQISSSFEQATEINQHGYGDVFKENIKMIEQNWLFGVGTKNYRLECKKVEFEANVCQTHPHNYYMEIWSEQGLIGILLYLGFIVAIARSLKKTYPQWRDNSLMLGGIGLIAAKFWPLIGSGSFFASWTVMGMWLAIGWVMAQNQRYLDQKEPYEPLV